MDFTEAQQRVATCRDKTVVVLAAVGSGKTTTLSERVANAVASGIEPARVLALTFTNRAAQRMRESLAERDAVAARRVHVHTFHGLCSWILRTEARTLGLSPSVWVHDEEDAEELIRAMGVNKPRQAMFRLHAAMSAEPVGEASLGRYRTAAFSDERWARPYLKLLGDRGAVDFGTLVYLTRALLSEHPGVAEKWARRFDWVQVDEVQDTHLSEYDIIRHLASRAESLCLVGDLDQTIYGWRGSDPQALIRAIESDRGPATRIDMTENFRSTRALLRVADVVAEGLNDRATRVTPAAALEEGDPPTVLSYDTPHDESLGIAAEIARRIAAGTDPHQIAILSRANWTTELIAKALDAHQIPATTVESFKYFRRMEVKDALALLKLVVDSDSPAAAHRVALKLVRGVGKVTLERIRQEGEAAGMRLVDLLDSELVERGDPLWGLDCEEYVVLDTETTGIDPQVDEVIEVGAVRVRNGEQVEAFEAFIKPSRPVGDSEAVHGISDAMLACEGRPAAEVFASLQAFIGDVPVAGHNVKFDLRMLAAHSARAGEALRFGAHFDSLRYARRLLNQDSYRLGDLCEALDLPAEATHRALDDVKTTVHLLFHLGTIAQRGRAIRTSLMKHHAPAFEKLRSTLQRWASLRERPGVLVHRILHEGGLLAYYKRHLDEGRLTHLAALSPRIAALDDPSLAPLEAARKALDGTALAREQDLLDQAEGVRVITIHQSKGLEFDHVYVPGMVDGRFPMWSAIEDNDTEEDRRVFYVAVTRAKKTITLSYYTRDQRGPCRPSRFLEGIAG